MTCKCGCGRLLKMDSKGRMPKYHSDCFLIGKPIPERVRKILSEQAKKPERIKRSLEQIIKLNQEVKTGIKKPGHFIDGVLRARDDGYIMILKPDHPRANKKGYVFEHILVLEKKLGRLLEGTEMGHHVNRVRHDNRPENIMLLSSQEEHQRIHAREDKRRDSSGMFKSFNKEKEDAVYQD